MDKETLEKDLKDKTRAQLLLFAQKQNIVVGPELSVKKMRAFIFEAMLTQPAGTISEQTVETPEKPTVGPPDETPPPAAPPDEPPEPPAELTEEEIAAEEKTKEEQRSLYQQYLEGPPSSVQMQFLDKIAADIQNVKTAEPVVTVAQLEESIKGWIYGLEDLI